MLEPASLRRQRRRESTIDLATSAVALACLVCIGWAAFVVAGALSAPLSAGENRPGAAAPAYGEPAQRALSGSDGGPRG